jgi:hypothetical protein
MTLVTERFTLQAGQSSQHQPNVAYEKKASRRQFITNRTARTQGNKNVGRKPVTHWLRPEREKKRERERNLKGRKRREGGHGSADSRCAPRSGPAMVRLGVTVQGGRADSNAYGPRGDSESATEVDSTSTARPPARLVSDHGETAVTGGKVGRGP